MCFNMLVWSDNWETTLSFNCSIGVLKGVYLRNGSVLWFFTCANHYIICGNSEHYVETNVTTSLSKCDFAFFITIERGVSDNINNYK